MARVDVGARQLQQAAESHWQAKDKLPGDGLRRARHLLEFYAVECAMKARVLGLRGVRTTACLDSEFGSNGHDLTEGLKACRVPATACRNPPVVCDAEGDEIPTSRLHEAWRYGAKLDGTTENQFSGWLESLYTWLKEAK